MASSQLDSLSQWMIQHHDEVIESERDSSSEEEDEVLVTPKSSRLRSLSCDPLVSWMKTYERGVEWSDTKQWTWGSVKGKERAMRPILDPDLPETDDDFAVDCELDTHPATPIASSSRNGRCSIGSHVSLRSSGGAKGSRQTLHSVGLKCLSFFFDCPKRGFRAKERVEKIKHIRKVIDVLEENNPDIRSMVFPHAGHCQNLALPPPSAGPSSTSRPADGDAKWHRSIEGLRGELRMAEELGLKYLVVHPGSSKNPNRGEVIRNIASNLDHLLLLHPTITLVLESMACKSTSMVGCTFTELAAIRTLCSQPNRVKFCLDVAHIHAQTHDLAMQCGQQAFFEDAETILGAENVVCIHLSDTHAMSGSGSHDHCSIGKGTIGNDAIRNIIRSRIFNHVGWILETSRFFPSNITSRRIETLEARRTKEEMEFLRQIVEMDDNCWDLERDGLEAARERQSRIVSTMLRAARPEFRKVSSRKGVARGGSRKRAVKAVSASVQEQRCVGSQRRSCRPGEEYDSR